MPRFAFSALVVLAVILIGGSLIAAALLKLAFVLLLVAIEIAAVFWVLGKARRALRPDRPRQLR
jgi:hypothetical protein